MRVTIGRNPFFGKVDYPKNPDKSQGRGSLARAVLDGEPGAVVVGRLPEIARGSIVAERDSKAVCALGIRMVRADGKRRGKRHPDVVRRRANGGETVHALAVSDLAAPEDLGHVAVGKTAVASEQHRAARKRDVVVDDMRDDRHVEGDLDYVAELPVAGHCEIGTRLHAILRRAVHFHDRLRAPGGNSEPHRKRTFRDRASTCRSPSRAQTRKS